MPKKYALRGKRMTALQRQSNGDRDRLSATIHFLGDLCCQLGLGNGDGLPLQSFVLTCIDVQKMGGQTVGGCTNLLGPWWAIGEL